MKRKIILLLLIISLFLVFGCSSSEKTFPNQDNSGNALVKGTLEDLSFQSAYVPDATGAPGATKHMYVYLPPNYDQEQGKKYPVVYLLHGYGGDYTTWVNAYKINDVLDVMIAEGKIKPCIVVMPDGSNPAVFQGQSNGGSFYTNSVFDPTYQLPIDQNAAFGLFEFYMVGEPTQALGVDPNSVIGWFENSSPYAQYVDKERRAIAGHSMGGYGAMMLTLKYPMLFNATAAMSPPVAFEEFFKDDPEYQVDIIDRIKFFELPLVRDSIEVAPGVKMAYFNPENLSIQTPLSVIMYALSSMFSPVVKERTQYDLSYEVPLADLQNGLTIGVDLPINVNGDIMESVKQRWLTYYDAYNYLNNKSASSYSSNHFYIDCGIYDVTDPNISQDGAGFGIINHVRVFHELMLSKGIDHFYEEYNGNHSNQVYYRVQKALEFLGENWEPTAGITKK